MGQGGNGKGRGWQCGSKKSKLIPFQPRGTGLKSCLIPAPPLLQNRENLHGAKRVRPG